MITSNKLSKDLADKNAQVKKAWITPSVEIINTDDIESGTIHWQEAIYHNPGSTAAFTHFVS